MSLQVVSTFQRQELECLEKLAHMDSCPTGLQIWTAVQQACREQRRGFSTLKLILSLPCNHVACVQRPQNQVDAGVKARFEHLRSEVQAVPIDNQHHRICQ